jgi:GAF domain-containing protein
VCAQLACATNAWLFVYDELTDAFSTIPAKKNDAAVRATVRDPIFAFVVAKKTPLSLGDAARDQKALGAFDAAFGTSSRNLMAVPLLSSSAQLLAVMVLTNKKTAAFSDADRTAVESLLSFASSLLANCNAHAALRAQRDALRNLADRANRLVTEPFNRQFFSAAHSFALAALPASAFSLHVLKASGDAFVTTAARSEGGSGGGSGATAPPNPPLTFETPAGVGIVGSILPSPSAQIVADLPTTTNSNRALDMPFGEGLPTAIFAPVRINGVPAAVAQWLRRRDECPFAPFDAALADVVASFCARLMEADAAIAASDFRARVVEALVSKYRSLVSTAQALSTAGTLDAVVAAVAAYAAEILNVARAALFEFDRDAGEVYELAGRGVANVRYPLIGTVGHVITSGAPVVANAVGEAPQFDARIDQRGGAGGGVTRNVICVPLRNSRGDIVGALQLANKGGGGGFDEVDVAIASALATLSSASVERLANVVRWGGGGIATISLN